MVGIEVNSVIEEGREDGIMGFDFHVRSIEWYKLISNVQENDDVYELYHLRARLCIPALIISLVQCEAVSRWIRQCPWHTVLRVDDDWNREKKNFQFKLRIWTQDLACCPWLENSYDRHHQYWTTHKCCKELSRVRWIRKKNKNLL